MDRDTDADWQYLAETNPYFAVYSIDRFQADRIDDSGIEAFYATGEREILDIMRYVLQRDPTFRSTRALDFGCGLGRVSLALARQADQVVGLDVAPAMLTKAHAAAVARGIGNVWFTEELARGDRFDLIISLIVLQHIPPVRGMVFIADMLGRLEIGGFCVLHMTLFRTTSPAVNAVRTGAFWFFDGDRMGMLVENDREPFGTMKMYDYDLNRVLAMMVSNGIAAYAMEMTDHNGNHGVVLYGHRDPQRYTVKPGRRYTARGAASFAPLLGSGWSYLEDWGVWTDGPEAIIEMVVPPGSAGVVRLEGRVFVVPERYPGIAISVDVNGTPAAFEPVRGGDSRAVVLIPAALADARGVMRLRLTIERPARLRPNDVNGETRLLGLGLEAITLLV